MIKSITVFLLFVVSAPFANADPVLIGKWKSDAELSMKFNRERAVMEEKTGHFLDQLLGHLTITFASNNATYDMPDLEVTSSAGKTSHMTGFQEKDPYEFLASTASQIAIRTVEPVTGSPQIVVYNFEDANTMWIYMGGGHFPAMNMREYFVRVK